MNKRLHEYDDMTPSWMLLDVGASPKKKKFKKRNNKHIGGFRDMVFNATFNISVISWWSVLLVEETGVHEENH
jgi:hypothetical protein